MVVEQTDVTDVAVDLGHEAGWRVNTIADGTPWWSTVDVRPVSARKAPTLAMARSLGQGATTNLEGAFSQGGLEAGSYELLVRDADEMALAWHGSSGDDARRARVVTLEEGERVSVDLVVSQADESIEGVVLDAEGRPVPDAWVHAVPRLTQRGYEALRGLPGASRGDEAAPATPSRRPRRGRSDAAKPRGHLGTDPVLTDHDGTFVLTGLREGTYDVKAKGAQGQAEGTAEEVASGSRAEVVLESLHTVRCEVTEQGRPVPEYRLTLERKGFLALSSRTTDVFDPAGTFEFVRVEAGAYRVFASTATSSGGTQVEIPASDSSPCRVEIEAHGTVVGSVVDSATGAPREGITIMLRGGAGGKGTSATSFLSDDGPMSDEGGAFRLEGVGPGVINVVFMDKSSTELVQGVATGVLRSGGVLDLGEVRLWGGSAVDAATRGSLGLSVKHVPFGRRPGVETAPDPNDETVAAQPLQLWVSAVTPGGPAAAAGVQVGDEIVRFDGRDVSDAGVFATSKTIMRSIVRGRAYEMSFQRGDASFDAVLTAAGPAAR